jgi:hypothetical protein
LAQTSRARTLRFMPQAALANLDPIFSPSTIITTHGYCVFDTLYGANRALQPRPQMAEGHSVEDDGKLVKIRLRDGLRWHDGEPVRAQDCVASIKRNLGHLNWKLRKVDLDIKETLTCVLARSILVYIGTPMVAAGLWKREDIDRMEAQLFREVNGLPNVISNKAILNVACSMRNAWEIVEQLAQRANLQSRRQQ